MTQKSHSCLWSRAELWCGRFAILVIVLHFLWDIVAIGALGICLF